MIPYRDREDVNKKKKNIDLNLSLVPNNLHTNGNRNRVTGSARFDSSASGVVRGMLGCAFVLSLHSKQRAGWSDNATRTTVSWIGKPVLSEIRESDPTSGIRDPI